MLNVPTKDGKVGITVIVTVAEPMASPSLASRRKTKGVADVTTGALKGVVIVWTA